MRRTLGETLGPLLGVGLFGAALWVLHREIGHYHYHEIAREVAAIPSARLLLALLCTALGYFLLTGYDALALGHLRRAIPFPRVALASFVANAMSHNIGFALLSGAAVRYRLYASWGLTGLEITQVIGFCSLTFWLGYLAVAGAAFLIDPPSLPAALPLATVRPLGVVFLAAVAGYATLCAVKRTRVRIREWEIALPTPTLAGAQIALSSLDWIVSGAVLYVLLPAGVETTFASFIGVFLVAQLAGVISQVPGGLGVFETVMILMLSGSAPAPVLLGSLLAYRGIYYLLPLAAAAALLGANEIGRRKEWIRRAAHLTGRWSAVLAPGVLAFTTALSGAILLFSGATPGEAARLQWLGHILPLPVIELSHFLGSLAGIGLLLLGRGLQQRLEAAWHMTAALLGSGILLSLLKGFDYEEAILLSVMLAALLSSRGQFYRRSSLLGEQLTPPWAAAVAVALLGSVWLGFFSHKHVEYAGEMWWQFTLSGDAPRFLRATVGVLVVLLVFALARLMRPAPPDPAAPSAPELELVRGIAAGSRETYACLALLGDKRFLMNDQRTAFVMYGVKGRSWVALGDPVGPEEEKRDLAWRFRELSDRHAGWTVFYEVGRDNLDLYVDLGLTIMKLGEEARVPLRSFTLEGSGWKGTRAALHRLEREGCHLEVVPPERFGSLLPSLREISDAWLAEKKVREKGFSLGSFEEGYLRCFPVAVVRRGGKLLAFANLMMGADREELSVDLMRYLPEAPPGVIEYLLIHLMMWGSDQGYQWFNLGMAPLAGLESRALAPRWARLGAFLYRHGESFYNFQGLRQYKQKFHPVWEPRYLASPGGLALPRILANLTALISGGLRGAIAR